MQPAFEALHMPCGYICAYSPSSSRRSDKVGELGCTRHLRAGGLQRGAVEMLAVGRDARSAAGSKRAGAVLVRMQEDSQKEPRWQARWTADSRDTATTTCRRRHLPKWDCRRNGSAARAAGRAEEEEVAQGRAHAGRPYGVCFIIERIYIGVALVTAHNHLYLR